MPKRSWKKQSEIQLVDEKNLKKLQRLVVEDEPKAIKMPYVEPNKFEDVDFTYGDDDYMKNEEKSEEWKNFYTGGAGGSDEVGKEFNENVQKCAFAIQEELSDYCGSMGDAFEGINDMDELPEELQKHINILKEVLKNYRSGPLPKTIKVLPHLPGWDGILELLEPIYWSRHCYERVTKVFMCNGRDPALHFFENYLLPKVQEDIAINKRLSVQLFEALMASMFRIKEFLSGIFYPWVKGEMSKVEGIVLANLMKKASLKPCFAAVALSLVCDQPFSIPRSMVCESILEKRYNLPEAAISKLLQYFIRMDTESSKNFTDEGRLPITWFRSLSIFLELYRDAVLPDERERLVKLCNRHEHPLISSQIKAFIQLIPTEVPV